MVIYKGRKEEIILNILHKSKFRYGPYIPYNFYSDALKNPSKHPKHTHKLVEKNKNTDGIISNYPLYTYTPAI